MEPSLPKNPETCPNCYVGRISQQSRSLVLMFDDKPLTFPDFPAWACDVCDAFVYDPAALAHLQVLLSSKKRPAMQYPPRKPSVKRRKVNKAGKAKAVEPK